MEDQVSYQFVNVNQTRKNRSGIKYSLILRQQPRQSRMCGVGEKADRRPIDPPPIVQLHVDDPNVPASEKNSYLQNPYYFMYASLMAADLDEELHLLRDGKTRSTTGSVVSSLYHLKDIDTRDAGFFVFPDLSVRMEGKYRLKLSLFEIIGKDVYHCKSILSDVFVVYSAKKFPGMEESTFLSRAFAEQGLKIRIRKESRQRLKQNRKKDQATDDPQDIMEGNAGKRSKREQKTLHTDLHTKPDTTGERQVPFLEDVDYGHPVPAPRTGYHAAPSSNNLPSLSHTQVYLPYTTSEPNLDRYTRHPQHSAIAYSADTGTHTIYPPRSYPGSSATPERVDTLQDGAFNRPWASPIQRGYLSTSDWRQPSHIDDTGQTKTSSTSFTLLDEKASPAHRAYFQSNDTHSIPSVSSSTSDAYTPTRYNPAYVHSMLPRSVSSPLEDNQPFDKDVMRSKQLHALEFGDMGSQQKEYERHCSSERYTH